MIRGYRLSEICLCMWPTTAQKSGAGHPCFTWTIRAVPRLSPACPRIISVPPANAGATLSTAGNTWLKTGMPGGSSASGSTSLCSTLCASIISGDLRPIGKFRPMNKPRSMAAGSKDLARICLKQSRRPLVPSRSSPKTWESSPRKWTPCGTIWDSRACAFYRWPLETIPKLRNTGRTTISTAALCIRPLTTTTPLWAGFKPTPAPRAPKAERKLNRNAATFWIILAQMERIFTGTSSGWLWAL